jgi:septal ring factor EnvC (AmiA/AmiB activator)
MPSANANSRPPRRRLAVASIVAAACLAVTLATGASSSAQSEQLDAVRAQQEQLRSQLADQNAAVDALLGQVSAARQREDKVSAELARQEAELAAARDELVRAREALARTKRRLTAARGDLRRLLVSLYRNGQPDAATLLLNSDGLDEFAATTAYLERIRDYEAEVVNNVRDLRTEAEDYVGDVEGSITRMQTARAEIAKRHRALAASRARLEQREAALQAAQSERRRQLSKLVGREKSLVEALSAPTPAQPPGGGETAAAPAAENVAPPNGSTATLNSDGTATAPADAPEAVKGAIAAANAISDTPYIYGGGHGSFESAGYDCSGAVSYALHGGGLLSSPLDSTGFMTWGEGGPGSWITVYSNPGHAFVVIAGLRFDTSGGAGPRWQGPRDPAGFVATHPPGY